MASPARSARSGSQLWRDLFVNGLTRSALVPPRLRWRLLRAYGMDVRSCKIMPGSWFGGRHLQIGPSTFVNYDCFFDTSAPIRIGRRVAIGMQVLFCTSSHEVGRPKQRAGKAAPAPIAVGDGCWIGARAMIMPGVTIGAGAIVGAGSVVTRDVPANTLVTGVPARVVRELDTEPSAPTLP